ncbi:MAG: C-GCAxxG-C-C family protein [Bacteroidales bacterium]
MKKQQQATNYFNNSFNCAQSVFTVFATDYGISENDSLKIACAFGGGMGRQQLTCGAVTGALMAIGLEYGKGIDDEETKKKETYQKTKEFLEAFIKLNGSVNCKVLLDGLDMQRPEDYEKMVQMNIFNTKCKKYVEDATLIAERIINRNTTG